MDGQNALLAFPGNPCVCSDKLQDEVPLRARFTFPDAVTRNSLLSSVHLILAHSGQFTMPWKKAAAGPTWVHEVYGAITFLDLYL